MHGFSFKKKKNSMDITNSRSESGNWPPKTEESPTNSARSRVGCKVAHELHAAARLQESSHASRRVWNSMIKRFQCWVDQQSLSQVLATKPWLVMVILLPLLHNFLHLDLGSLTQATTYHMFGNKPFLSYLTYMDTLSSVTLTNGLQTKCQGIRQTRL